MQAVGAGVTPRAPPSDKERKLMDVLLQATEARVAPLLACVKGWPLEAQADLANWRPVLLKLHKLLLGSLQQCPRLLLVETELDKTDHPITTQTEQELTELVYEILKFSGFLLENATNKAVYPSADPVMALLAARNERVVFEATKVAAMLGLPPQVHRYAADPTSFMDPAASKNNLLRRRLLTVAQGRGAPKNSLEVVDYLNAASAASPKDVDFQFYSSDQEENATSHLVSVAIPPYEEVVTAATSPVEAACAAATACERLIEQHKIPKRLHFQLYTQVRACYASRSALTRENLVVERLHALLALFSLFSDAWDVTNYVEQHPELTRGIVELIRVESIEHVPVRVRVTALLVLTALVNDRVGRAGGMGVLGRQSNVLQALGVAKGTPHGVFPSLVRFCTAELGDVIALGSTAATSGSSSPPAIASETADTDMDMSLAVAFVQATTDLLSPQEAEVVSAPPFRSVSSGSIQETKLCWMEAVLGLLTAVVAIQSGAAVLTENGIVPALLHVLTMPSVSAFHMAVTTQCVQALEITVSSHSAGAALYRDLNGVGILVDRLKLECASIAGSATSSSAVSETKTVLLLAILASLSMSFHSQGVMSAGATSRAIREGSALNKVLLQLLSNVDIFGPVVFAQTAIVVSDVINNDPSSVNHVHAAGLADAFLKTLTRWDIAELYPSRILLPPSSELLTAVPTVLNALCLTTAHAEKVAKYEPLMHLLDVFALPQYTEDESKDYCFQGDTAAVVGAGIFELMRHVPSFQNAAIQAAVHALKKVIRFGEESSSSTASTLLQFVGDKANGILIRMTTHVADLLEPLLSKSEHAAYFADLGGIRLLLALYQLILPSTSSFLESALPNKKTARGGLPENSLAHNPAVQSITLALRSYASQQPTNLLGAITKELGVQMDNLQCCRAKVGFPWFLSESGEGAEKVLSSLPDVDLADLVGGLDKSSATNPTADKVMVVGEYLRVLAVLEWLASVLIWTLETAHTHMQSRRWFTDFTASSTQQVMARLFRVDRSVQFERASLAALHQKKRNEKSSEKQADGEADANMEATTTDKPDSGAAKSGRRRAGIWKMGSLLLLRFSLSMRGLLTAYSKVLLPAPMQHRRGDDIVVPLAPHARALARAATQILEGHLLYVVSVTRATQIDTFVQQYYLTFLLETISIVLFEGKKKQANTLLLVELMKPIGDISDVQVSTESLQVLPSSSDDVAMVQENVSEGEGDAIEAGKAIATCAGAQITASNLMDVVMNIIERFFTVCLEGECDKAPISAGIKSSQMALTSFHIAASVLRKLSNLEALSASPLTAALLTSDEAGESDDAPFEPKKLTVQLHAMCVRALLSIWKNPKFSTSSVDSCLAEIMPVAVTILKNRMDSDDEAVGSDGDSVLGRRQGLGFSRSNRERNSSTELYNEALSLRRALFGGSRGGGSSGLGGSSRRQSFVPDSEIVESLVSMGFPQPRVERALRHIQVNNMELAMEWILGHPEDENAAEGDENQHDKATGGDSAAADAALRRERETAEDKRMEDELQALYTSLRESFEAVCFQILRVQATKEKREDPKRSKEFETPSNLYPSQNLVKAIAEYFSFLCSRSDVDRDLVIQRLNAAILDYFNGGEEGGDEYLTMLTHLLALVLQLNSDSWAAMQLQSPSCIDKLVASVSNNDTLKPSCTPVLLVLDAVVAGRAAKQASTAGSPPLDAALTNSEAKHGDESKEESSGAVNQAEDTVFEQQLVTICLELLKRGSCAASTNDSKAVAHATWQLLSRLTLKYDLASFFSTHGGLDAVLDIPEDLFFVGYQELTGTLLSQVLESPEVLEHMMEEKIRRAITKLSTRFGAPSQMRITPRALLTEVAPFAARNETVFLKALQNSVRVKKTESGRAYIVPRPRKSDSSEAATGQSAAQSLVAQDSAASGTKAPHKFPKDHKHQAHVIVHKIIGRIRRLWNVETDAKKQRDVQQTLGNTSAGMCVGVYLQLLVHLITYFPACATVLAKAKDEVDSHGERGSFVRLVLREFLPSRELCQFAAARKALKEDGFYGNSRLGSGDADLLVADAKVFVDSRTRMRVHNAHRLLVRIGSHSGEGSKCILLELVHLLQEWPQSGAVDLTSENDDLSVRDERALSSLHAWSGLIMSILWPKGSSKGFAWDKVVLGGGLKGKHSFVTLLAEALRKIDLTHPLAHATCTMLLRPLSTLTRSFVTHRVRRLLKKRNHSSTVSGDAGSAEGSQTQSASGAGTTGTSVAAGASSAAASGSSEDATVQGDRMEVDIDTREATNSSGSGFYPLREEDDDDVSMRSPLSAMDDHDMHDEDDEDEEHSDDERSDRSSVSDHSTDEGEGDDDEDDENDDDDEDEDDDEDDDDEDEDEFEEHHHLHISRRTGGHGTSRRTSSNRLWGSLDSELSILDALDEVDEEEFSYLFMLDDEAFFAEEQRRRARLAAARNVRPGSNLNEGSQQSNNSEDRLVESMRDALGLYNGSGGSGSNSSTSRQTLVLTFGDVEDDGEVESEAQADLATTTSHMGSGNGFGPSASSQSRLGGGAGSMANSLLQYIEELPDMLDDDFLFESFDAGGRGDRSRRDRHLGRPGGNGVDQFTASATTHPLLRMSGRGDAILLDSNGLLRNPGRFSLPRHSSLLRELQELTDQVQTQLPLGGSRSRLALGRDLLQRGGAGSRGRPPSRINRLSAVSNLLSEFSLDIPTSTLPSRSQRIGFGRGDRDIFSDVFVGVDLSRGLGSRGGNVMGGTASNPAIWGPGGLGRDVDVRSVASRLEQQITRICADDDEPTVTPAPGRDEVASTNDVDDIMEDRSATGTPRSGEHTASDSRVSTVAEGSNAQADALVNSDRTERSEAATEAASVLELTSTLGETSLLRSPPASDVDVDIVDADADTLSEGQEATVGSPSAVSSARGSSFESAAPPPAPTSLSSAETSTTTTAPSPSDSMMNFTLDLSGFGATSSQSTAASDNTNRARNIEEESKSEELPSSATQAASGDAATPELSAALLGQPEEQQYQCPEGMDAEVFASLPPDMQAEIIAQNAPAVAESTSARSDTATAGGGGGGSESMSQMDLDMANSSFDRETLEALPADIRAEVLENERREREAAARAETADTSRAQEMDNASFVASLAPELREEILVTCDDAFLQTLPSQVRAEAMVLRERAAFHSTYRERERGTAERGGGGEGDMDELFNRPTLRRMLTSHSPDRGNNRRRSRVYDELGGGRRSSRRDYQPGVGGSKAHKGLLRVEKDEEEEAGERIFDDRCVRGLLRLLFMTQSVIQNRVFQRLLANICLYPLTRCSVRRNVLRVISLPLSQPLIPGDEKDDDDDGSGKIQFPPSRMYGCGIDGNHAIGASAVPAEVVNRMLHVFVSLAKYNPRFTVEMLQPHGMRHVSNGKDDSVKMETSRECGVSVLIDLLSLPVVYRNGTNLDALLELLELVLSPLERLHKPKSEDEEKKEADEGDTSTPEPGDEWVAVPVIELDEARMVEIVSVLSMDLCTVQMQERTLAVLKLLNHVAGNRELIIRAIVRHASTLAHVDQYKRGKLPAGITGYESSAVLPSAQDELKLLRLLHSLSDVCESTSDFAECCQTIGLDPLWDALSLSLTEARAKGGLEDQDNSAAAPSATAPLASSVAGSETQAATGDDAEGMVIEGKSAGASCAMAALLARFLPLVEAFFVVNARDAASMSLRVPDSSEREEAVVAALRAAGFDGAGATALMENEQKASPKSALKRSSSALSEASETMRLANFVESNRVLLNLLVREKPALLDTSLAALIKIPRCRAYLAFDNKRTFFHSSMKRLRQAALRNHGGGSSSVRIPVRREHIFEDSYYALRMRSGTELRRKLHISFTGEEGIDAGGVTREWYMILAREMFNPNYVLFTSAADSPTFQPNPLSYVNKDHLSYFEFVGKVLGKAVADGQLLDAHFTRSFYKHILQLPISYHDMEAIDPEYYRNLHSILDNSIVDLGLELTFSAEQSNFGKVEVVDLIPNGRNVPVTDENKMEYVKLVTHHRMATGIRQQIDAFLKGFHQLVPPELIAIFNENELELLISGMPEIDIDDLKANTEYANYKPTDSVIRWFWNVLYSFTHEERALFLQFVTGTSKVPLEGFKALEGMRGTQKFNIHKAFGNNSALPSAHTCFNQLDLPEYESEDKLKQCLLLAIREGSEGFGFG
ncbi:E3 ubiquitin-protein ligase [Phytophthora idaei]|nr:E3 ubiquitin-protein ligase [Phytophthora idaei]KAG3162067.1 E3 ubiquitin-protein ligase [Phytophthora idaei]KAG3252546.1 E3 ubiquitin-protein ligase [Phytophthora idaei]